MCSDAIPKKLNEFGLDFRTGIVAITTDGCVMVRKLGRIIPPFQQLCYAHGLQLVIQDILYRNKHISQKLILTTTSVRKKTPFSRKDRGRWKKPVFSGKNRPFLPFSIGWSTHN